MKGIELIAGVIGGMIAGVILFAIARISLDWGLTLFPLGELFFQLLPGIILGGILGAMFPRFFSTFPLS